MVISIVGQFFPDENDAPWTNDGNAYPMECGENFREMVQKYIRMCQNVIRKILDHLTPFLDLDLVRTTSGNKIKSATDPFDDPMFTMRFLHYPPEQGKITPHTDFGVLTVLWQDEVGGLQVWVEQLQQWKDVAPVPNTFVVNVADMLQIWSHGRLKSTRHQVKNEGLSDRYSIGYFGHMGKHFEIYSQATNEWISQYRSLTQRHYQMFQYLNTAVPEADQCMQGKSAQEVDTFHEKVVADIAARDGRV